MSETASTNPFMPAARVGDGGGPPAPLSPEDPNMQTLPRVTKRPDPFDRPTTPAEAGYPRVSFRDAGGAGAGPGGGPVSRNTVPRTPTPMAAPAPGRTPPPAASRPGFESTEPPPMGAMPPAMMGPPMPSPMPGPPMPSPMPGPPMGPMGSPHGMVGPPMPSPMPGPPMMSPYPGPPVGPPPRARGFYLVIGAIALLVVAATLSIVLAASNG